MAKEWEIRVWDKWWFIGILEGCEESFSVEEQCDDEVDEEEGVDFGQGGERECRYKDEVVMGPGDICIAKAGEGRGYHCQAIEEKRFKTDRFCKT